MLNASVDMLYYLDLKPYADTIKLAIEKTLNEDFVHTPGTRLILHLKILNSRVIHLSVLRYPLITYFLVDIHNLID